MARTVCGWCGVYVHMPRVDDPVEKVTDEELHEFRLTATHKCDSCGNLSLSYVTIVDAEMGPDARDFSARGRHNFASNNNMLSWYPPPDSATRLAHVPPQIASAADEAQKCMGFGALRAAVQLARSVVEATAKDKGITCTGTASKIKEMHKHGLIREYVRDGANEVRELGNDMAHGDFTEAVSRADAVLVLELMNEVLNEVYEGPGKVAEARARREARTQSPGQPTSNQ